MRRSYEISLNFALCVILNRKNVWQIDMEAGKSRNQLRSGSNEYYYLVQLRLIVHTDWDVGTQHRFVTIMISLHAFASENVKID